jgi:cardiolipin synthase
VFASLVLAELAFRLEFHAIEAVAMASVAVLTLASIGFYVREWVLHMSVAELER